MPSFRDKGVFKRVVSVVGGRHLTGCCESDALCGDEDTTGETLCNALIDGGEFCWLCVEQVRLAIGAPRSAPLKRR
jgi:hypothetical protein